MRATSPVLTAGGRLACRRALRRQRRHLPCQPQIHQHSLGRLVARSGRRRRARKLGGRRSRGRQLLTGRLFQRLAGGRELGLLLG